MLYILEERFIDVFILFIGQGSSQPIKDRGKVYTAYIFPKIV